MRSQRTTHTQPTTTSPTLSPAAVADVDHGLGNFLRSAYATGCSMALTVSTLLLDGGLPPCTLITARRYPRGVRGGQQRRMIFPGSPAEFSACLQRALPTVFNQQQPPTPTTPITHAAATAAAGVR